MSFMRQKTLEKNVSLPRMEEEMERVLLWERTGRLDRITEDEEMMSSSALRWRRGVVRTFPSSWSPLPRELMSKWEEPGTH